jgi:hypothetical protein
LNQHFFLLPSFLPQTAVACFYAPLFFPIIAQVFSIHGLARTMAIIGA